MLIWRFFLWLYTNLVSRPKNITAVYNCNVHKQLKWSIFAIEFCFPVTIVGTRKSDILLCSSLQAQFHQSRKHPAPTWVTRGGSAIWATVSRIWVHLPPLQITPQHLFCGKCGVVTLRRKHKVWVNPLSRLPEQYSVYNRKHPMTGNCVSQDIFARDRPTNGISVVSQAPPIFLQASHSRVSVVSTGDPVV